MKIYVLTNSGVEHRTILGVYTDKEQAEKDMEFIVAEEIKDIISDDTYQQRWVKVEDVWYCQSRFKCETEQWDEWPAPQPTRTGDRIRIVEYETSTLSMQEQVDAINAWQANGRVHQLTCGNDSSHPDLEPYYDHCWPGVGLCCKVCDWRQKSGHPVLDIVYAAYISNRPSAT